MMAMWQYIGFRTDIPSHCQECNKETHRLHWFKISKNAAATFCEKCYPEIKKRINAERKQQRDQPEPIYCEIRGHKCCEICPKFNTNCEIRNERNQTIDVVLDPAQEKLYNLMKKKEEKENIPIWNQKRDIYLINKLAYYGKPIAEKQTPYIEGWIDCLNWLIDPEIELPIVLKRMLEQKGAKLMEIEQETKEISEQLCAIFETHFKELLEAGDLKTFVTEIVKQTLIQKKNRDNKYYPK